MLQLYISKKYLIILSASLKYSRIRQNINDTEQTVLSGFKLLCAFYFPFPPHPSVLTPCPPFSFLFSSRPYSSCPAFQSLLQTPRPPTSLLVVSPSLSLHIALSILQLLWSVTKQAYCHLIGKITYLLSQEHNLPIVTLFQLVATLQAFSRRSIKEETFSIWAQSLDSLLMDSCKCLSHKLSVAYSSYLCLVISKLESYVVQGVP